VLREGVRHHPDLSSARVVAARLHVWDGRPGLAADILADVLVADPANDSARQLLVRLLAEQGRFPEARSQANVLAMSGATSR
jgi:protein involved in temperature-dependent protein secretion